MLSMIRSCSSEIIPVYSIDSGALLLLLHTNLVYFYCAVMKNEENYK